MKALHLALTIFSLFCGGQLLADTPRMLIESSDSQLQLALESVIEEQGLATAVSKQQLAVVLVQVSDPANPRLAELNGHTMLSMPQACQKSRFCWAPLWQSMRADWCWMKNYKPIWIT